MAPKENDDKDPTMEKDDIMLAEYESRFDEIDSTLEELRSSILQDDTKEKEENDDDDEATVDTVSYTLNIATMQASLAEESAKEMQEIVQGLKEEKQGQQHKHEENVKTKHPERRTDQPTTSPAATTRQLSSSTRSGTQKTLFFVIVPIVLAVGFAWKFASLQQQPTTGREVTTSLQRQPSTTTVHYQESRKRQICRTNIYGQKTCESEEEEQSRSTSHDEANTNNLVRNNNQHQHPQTQGATTNYKYARQTCRYVNGQSYCETYEQSQSASNT